MFIRWQSRQRKRAEFGDSKNDTHWRAVLVESARIGGKPRHRHIAYLIGFTESAAAIPAQRRLIWEHIELRLKDLGKRIPAKDRGAIMLDEGARALLGYVDPRDLTLLLNPR